MHYTPRGAVASRAGFSLVEIMIAVVIIGLLAMLSVPTITRTQLAAKRNRFISDVRTFTQAFESHALQNGDWPANAGNGVVPAGMSGSFSRTWSDRNSLGGRWNWDRSNNGIAAGIATTGVTVTDAQMTLIDARIDDGDLDNGIFRKVNSRFIYILEN